MLKSKQNTAEGLLVNFFRGGILKAWDEGGCRMPKKRVYVESSVISYLTARPASVAEKRVMQEQTRIWWERRDRWELFIAPMVVFEIRRGSPDAAGKRLDVAESISLLPETPEARRLANHLLTTGVMPKNSYEDAVHIAVAAVCEMDFLVTWNQSHIFNPETIGKLYSTVREAGYKPPTLVRPDNLLEMENGS